ncbi:hypothetical protein Droror1_Dr00015614 [Drosera rotundifolia]
MSCYTTRNQPEQLFNRTPVAQQHDLLLLRTFAKPFDQIQSQFPATLNETPIPSRNQFINHTSTNPQNPESATSESAASLQPLSPPKIFINHKHTHTGGEYHGRVV